MTLGVNTYERKRKKNVLFAIPEFTMQKILLIILLTTYGVFASAQCGTDARVIQQYGDQLTGAIHFSELLEHGHEISDAPQGLKHKAQGVRTIPVVFHVLHQYGEENISKAQIEDQLRVLNEDFQRLNSDTTNTRAEFKSRSVSFDLEFKLARKLPDITTTTPNDSFYTEGIIRYYSPLTNEPAGYDHSKSVGIYPYQNYLNIWVVNSIDDGDDDPTTTLLGYAVFPTDPSGSIRDGIVIRADEIGTIGTSSKTGRTLTHEIGHWLGLYHTFQGACSTNKNWTDRVDDTPPVNGPSRGCDHSRNSCSNDDYIPGVDEKDMVENYMDYSSGWCMNAFTAGQKARIDGFMNDSTLYRGRNVALRNVIRTGVNTNPPSKPIADFYVEDKQTTVCAGNALQFINYSYNASNMTYSWKFEGGTPATSTGENPTVFFNTPGQYTVELTATNAYGSDTKVHTKIINVMPSNADLKAPYGNDFAAASDIDDWSLDFDTYGWRRNTSIGYSGNTSVEARINASAPSEARYEMILPPVDLSDYEAPANLTFKVAYAPRYETDGEILIMYVSTDCGNSWRIIHGLNRNNGLMTHDQQAGWTPSSASDWSAKTISLSKYENDSNVMVKFVAICNSGNSIFLDNINIGAYALDVPALPGNEAFTMYPNPATDEVHISTSFTTSKMEVSVLDITGRLLLHHKSYQNDQTISTTDLPNGMYVVKVSAEGNTWSQKLVINR